MNDRPIYVPYALIQSGVLASLGGAAARVLLALAARDNQDHAVYPSRPQIADDTGLALAAVDGAIKALEAAGIVAVKRAGNERNQYRIQPPEAWRVVTKIIATKSDTMGDIVTKIVATKTMTGVVTKSATRVATKSATRTYMHGQEYRNTDTDGGPPAPSARVASGPALRAEPIPTASTSEPEGPLSVGPSGALLASPSEPYGPTLRAEPFSVAPVSEPSGHPTSGPSGASLAWNIDEEIPGFMVLTAQELMEAGVEASGPLALSSSDTAAAVASGPAAGRSETAAAELLPPTSSAIPATANGRAVEAPCAAGTSRRPAKARKPPQRPTGGKSSRPKRTPEEELAYRQLQVRALAESTQSSDAMERYIRFGVSGWTDSPVSQAADYRREGGIQTASQVAGYSVWIAASLAEEFGLPVQPFPATTFGNLCGRTKNILAACESDQLRQALNTIASYWPLVWSRWKNPNRVTTRTPSAAQLLEPAMLRAAEEVGAMPEDARNAELAKLQQAKIASGIL